MFILISYISDNYLKVSISSNYKLMVDAEAIEKSSSFIASSMVSSLPSSILFWLEFFNLRLWIRSPQSSVESQFGHFPNTGINSDAVVHFAAKHRTWLLIA